MPIEAGAKAPDFTLPGNGGATIKLSDLAGKPVVVYFYPKADTSGCTKEAMEFTALKSEFAKAGATVVGVSADPITALDKFQQKYDLGIALASDEGKGTLEAYGVWVEKSMYGKKYMGIERATFLVGKDGKIARVWPKVKVDGHAKEVLAAVNAL